MIRPSNPYRRTLTEAIESNDPAALEALFQQGVNPNIILCEDGEVPLLKAARRGSDRALHVILEHGATVTATDTWNNTALHYAADAGNMSCVHQLLQRGSPINALNYYEVTPLMQAASSLHVDVVRHLDLARCLHDTRVEPL
eukprot:TsM_001129700 transcript=TsM_001129700 gene=TsM_001129700